MWVLVLGVLENGGADTGGSASGSPTAGGTGSRGAADTGRPQQQPLQPQQTLSPHVTAVHLLGLPYPSTSRLPPSSSLSLSLYGPTFPRLDTPRARPPPCSRPSPPWSPDLNPSSHTWVQRSPRRCLASPVLGIHSMILRYHRPRVPPPDVFLLPPFLSLDVSFPPFADFLRAACPPVPRVLSSLATDTTAPPWSDCALFAY
ncbi:unnamed protein product [Closterium sp. NIES-54]